MRHWLWARFHGSIDANDKVEWNGRKRESATTTTQKTHQNWKWEEKYEEEEGKKHEPKKHHFMAQSKGLKDDFPNGVGIWDDSEWKRKR